ncbi:hypothetical protein BDV96DRAFT_599245 [Lophiotrema nucula]|uniref:GPI anchored protein n=1 Tax=Lophiotrema nucula TaxID=690887 RepID=A0A6A5Z8Y9_9PLEO|nr:hypothetical protein BDV96DRAFT_599245 [Lophiotrema nucula]
MYSVILLLNIIYSVGASLYPDESIQVPQGHRILKAARKHSDLAKRSNDLSLTHDINLVYAEERGFSNNRPTFASELWLTANEPTLYLENYDHLFNDIECNRGEMTITVRDAISYNKACKACESLIDGWVVSSHSSCSDDGVHSVYNVLGHHFDNETSRITLQVDRSNLADVYKHKTFQFGHTDELYVTHRHDRLARRKLEEPPTHALHERQVLTGTPSTSAVVTATAAPDDSTTLASMNFSEIDTTFMLPGNISLPFDLGCSNCSGNGELVLKTVTLEFDSFGGIFEGKGLFKQGAVELDLNDFWMSIGLRATPEVTLDKTLTIFKNFLVGYFVPDVFSIGVDFEFGLEFIVDVEAPIELGFGFDVTVPNSSIRADIANSSNSGFHGFNPDITAHPLTSNASDTELFLSAGLTSSLPVGLTILGIEFSIGPKLQLPFLDLNVTQLNSTDVGANCEKGGDTVPKFVEEFHNLTHISYDVGLSVELDIDIIVEFPITFFATSTNLTTQCMVYQTSGSETGLAFATGVLAAITAPPSPSATPSTPKKKGAASGLSVPAFLYPLAVVAVLL